MFKTSGYFKGLPCPYFENGLCERPYCHFGHFKAKSQPPTPVFNASSTLIIPVHSKLPGDAKSLRKDDVCIASDTPGGSSTFQKLDKVKWYNPTPIPKLLSHAEKERRKSKQKKLSVPEYKPTPIHLLQKSASARDNKVSTNKINHNDEYVPTPIVRDKLTTRKIVESGRNLSDESHEVIKCADTKPTKVADSNIQDLCLPTNENADSQTSDKNNFIQNDNKAEPNKSSNVLSETTTTDMVKETNSECVETINSDNSITVQDVEKCRVDVLLIENETSNEKKDSQLDENEMTIEKKDSQPNDIPVVVVDESSSQDEIKVEVQSISSESEKNCEVVNDNQKQTDELGKTGKEVSLDSNEQITKESESKTVSDDIKKSDKEENTDSVVQQCSCSKPKENISSSDKKHGKNKKHKKHKKRSSSSRKHKSSKSSHKNKSHKKKKRKHKSSSKKSKYHSSSSSDSSSSSSLSEDEEKKVKSSSQHKRSHKRSSRKPSVEEKHLKKHKRKSASSSRSSSRGRKKRSKERSSKSSKPHKHSKASKRRHSSSSSSRSSSSSSSHYKHSVKRRKSADSKKGKFEKHDVTSSKAPDTSAKRKKEVGDSENKSNCDSVTPEKKSLNSISKPVVCAKPEAISNTKTTEKRHVNIFEALNETVQQSTIKDIPESTSSGKSTKEVDHSQLVEDSRSLLNNNHPPTPTASKPNKKPVFQKSTSHIALFGEDSDQELPMQSEEISRKNDSDSDSIVLSSDSDLPHLNTTVKPAKVKSPLPAVDLDDVDFSDNDPFDECLQIFNESSHEVQSAHRTNVKDEPKKDIGDKGGLSCKKKREAHSQIKVKSSTQQRIDAERPKPRPSASQVLHSRLLAAQEQNLAEQEEFLQRKKPKMSQDPFAKKQRVAHFPKPKPEKTQKKKLNEGTKKDGPIKKKVKRPIIPPDFGSKVPTSVRQQYLNKMIDDCLKIYTEDQDAYDRALKEEKIVYDRSNNKMVYVRVSVNAIKKLRDEISCKSQGHSKTVVSHMSVLGGAKAAHTHFTLNRSGNRKPIELTVSLFCQYLEESQLMTESQLEENGFPRTDLERPGHARFTIRDKEKLVVTTDKMERQCVRCGRRFHVSPIGNYVRKEDCIYHWGKAWKRKIAGSWDNKWTCCGGDLSSKGCQICKAHVHEHNKYTTTSGFVKTLPCSPKPDDDCRVYSLDCEMVYTIEGLELARVTVVDFNKETVLEKLVKPSGEVIDYNTRFSGIKEADMKGVKTCLRDIQAILLSLFTQQTILLGHSLESDLMALKLIHSNVVDTSIIFPHKLGLPYKRALKTLMGEYLQKIIQEDEGGHDSLEDASACMELMIWKAKNDLKYTKLKGI